MTTETMQINHTNDIVNQISNTIIQSLEYNVMQFMSSNQAGKIPSASRCTCFIVVITIFVD